MHLTGNELSAASSVVAALAIIGGFLGVHSANRNALTLAREERTAKKDDDFDQLKRVTYVNAMRAIDTLQTLKMEQVTVLSDPTVNFAEKSQVTKRLMDSIRAANDSITELSLITDNPELQAMGTSAFTAAGHNDENTSKIVDQFFLALHNDFHGKKPSNLEDQASSAGEVLAELSRHDENSS